MSSTAGLPQTPEQKPPMRRGVKEAVVALAALPLLLAAGVYIGGRLSTDGPASLQPAVPVAGAARTPSPLVTVKPATPRALVTVKPAAPAPVVTVKPRSQAPVTAATTSAPRPAGPVGPVAASPVVTVRPPAPSPVVTVKPPAPSPVATVKPAAPRPAATPPVGPIPTSPTAPTSPAAPGPTAAGPVAPTAPPPAPSRVLGVGSSGADVRAWQRQMARRHWRITVDGIFGPQTRQAALAFQRIKGLRVDGLVGSATWDAAWRLPVLL